MSSKNKSAKEPIVSNSDNKSVRTMKSLRTANSLGKSDSGRVQVTTYATRIMAEQVKKEQRARDNFESNVLIARKNRNPVVGELTPRDDAEFLIPYHHRMKIKAQSDKILTMSAMYNMNSTLNNSKRPLKMNSFDEDQYTIRKHTEITPAIRFKKLDTLKIRKDRLELEIEQLNRVTGYHKSRLQSELSPIKTWGIGELQF